MQKILVLAIYFLNLISNIIFIYLIKKYQFIFKIKTQIKKNFQALKSNNYLLIKRLLYPKFLKKSLEKKFRLQNYVLNSKI